jgi:aminoglycoside/choline kinase family phosphotransferase
MALQRNMKALGTFAFQAAVKGNPRYIPSIQPTIAYLQENLARHPELRVLGEILDEHLFSAYPGVLPTWLVDPPGE